MAESDTPFFEQFSLDVETAFGIKFGRHPNLNVYCPFHDDRKGGSPSCSVSKIGLFHCKSCGAKGDAVTFYAKARGITYDEALTALRSPNAPALDTSKYPPTRHGSHDPYSARSQATLLRIASACQDTLKSTRHDYLDYLRRDRGLDDDTIEAYGLGADEYRITIPVPKRGGGLRNIRRYLPKKFNTSQAPKIVSHIIGDGTPCLWPCTTLENLPPGSELIICEGEFDAMLLSQELGCAVVTPTAGCQTWNPEWLEEIKAYRVRWIYDVNDVNETNPELNDIGQKCARRNAEYCVEAGMEDVRVVTLPLDIEGGDITDWFITCKRTAQELRELIDSTPPIVHRMPAMQPFDHDESTAEEAQAPATDAAAVDTPTAPADNTSMTWDKDNVLHRTVRIRKDPPNVPLAQASEPPHYLQHIRIRALVAGHGTTPYIIPKRVAAIATLADQSVLELNKVFTAWDPAVLSLLQVSEAEQSRTLRKIFSLPKDATISVQTFETHTVEEVWLTPTIEAGAVAGNHVLRRCFFIGSGLQTNQVYDFHAYTAPHPQTQAATHVLTKATPAVTDLDHFQMTPELFQQLHDTFAGPPHEMLQKIAQTLSESVTHIVGRTDLHVAVDLVYHSPLSFYFDGTEVRKGWLECLIMGDTRTGKGFVTENLARHYGLGEVISGESLTYAGLVAGVQRVGDRWTLIWGKLPINDRRLVVIDEASALSTGDIGKISRIRSEGTVETTKIITERTTARTRLIWLSNPRGSSGTTPRMIRDYAFGIEAAAELVGTAEDLARFDYVLIVSQNEVAAERINQASHPKDPPPANPYTSELCQSLILWAWSRTKDQIQFTPEAVSLVYKAAQALGGMFTPRICLIQAEDVRFKVARLAAAIAARTFSSPDGMNLVITRDHVQVAYNFLVHIYNKPGCGYSAMSALDARNSRLRDEDNLMQAFQNFGNEIALDLVEGILEVSQLTERDIAAYGGLDVFQARDLLSVLVRCRAITRKGFNYEKTPAFRTWLNAARRNLAVEPPTTEHEHEHSEHTGMDTTNSEGS